MALLSINLFLEKFFKQKNANIFLMDAIIATITEVTNITLPKNTLVLKNSILYIKAAPALKNELFMKKDYILKQLQKEAGQTRIVDLR